MSPDLSFGIAALAFLLVGLFRPGRYVAVAGAIVCIVLMFIFHYGVRHEEVSFRDSAVLNNGVYVVPSRSPAAVRWA